MYRDTALIKKHITKVRLDDGLDRQVEAICDLTGQQKAVIMRKLVEIGISRFHESDLRPSISGQEVTLSAL